ncbi:hypothetical protein GCM10025868_25200 [Angustibacter aerolatus]|uniref:Uncharacterized protein n=1 Tax=Angustibacter aerolatus TaxID=1162965 RepID=A0ABQ6JGF2_9ACTN|nr:hypothetical protein GCM10025868_25200 [Angustibacter aerolatus]
MGPAQPVGVRDAVLVAGACLLTVVAIAAGVRAGTWHLLLS